VDRLKRRADVIGDGGEVDVDGIREVLSDECGE
jgi:hypothetical protein